MLEILLDIPLETWKNCKAPTQTRFQLFSSSNRCHSNQDVASRCGLNNKRDNIPHNIFREFIPQGTEQQPSRVVLVTPPMQSRMLKALLRKFGTPLTQYTAVSPGEIIDVWMPDIIVAEVTLNPFQTMSECRHHNIWDDFPGYVFR